MNKIDRSDPLKALLNTKKQLDCNDLCRQLIQAAQVAKKNKNRTALAAGIAALVDMLGADPTLVKNYLITQLGEAAAKGDAYWEFMMHL